MFAYYADCFFGLHPAQSQREWMLRSSVVGKIKIQDDSIEKPGSWGKLQDPTRNVPQVQYHGRGGRLLTTLDSIQFGLW